MIDADIYRRMVEQASDYAVFALDTEGRVVTWNTGAERIKGYTAEEILGRHFSLFYPADRIQSGWPQQELNAAVREGRFEDEGWRIRKDGSRFWANVVITALRDEDGKLIGFSKITRDLTERRSHEETLRHSEERFRLLIEGVQDYAIYMLDKAGVVTSWNSGAQRITGYARTEVVGKHFSCFYPHADIASGTPWEHLALARRQGRVESEGWRLRKNGERFWARVVVSALYDSEGRLRGFAKVTQDLTERRHMEDLAKAAENVNEFIAMLAHELRNPLAPIRAAVHVLGMKAEPDNQPLVSTIDRQSMQLAHIVDDMIDISSITRGRLRIERKPIDLREVVERSIETAKPALDQARHHVQIEVPTEEVPVLGDLQRLVQAVTNLLTNAARYTPEGGRVTVRVTSDDGEATLSVRDNGRGIEPDMVERIFDMFVQGRAPLQRVGGGLGIGLALARRIIELHGGSLNVASEGANRGSEFTLRLPRRETAAAEPQSPERAPSSRKATTPKRVLVVDDNADAADTLDLLLKTMGHRTCVAYDGRAALKLCEEFRPDVVLLDIGMPGMDGYEVARRLRSDATRGPTRIVAVTGWGQESDRERSKEAGFDMHLVKPIDTSALVQILERTGATLH